MNTSRWISWAGLAAMIGGALAILLTAPFATAMFSAYPGDIPPFWLKLLRPLLRPLITFAAPIPVYNIYGRIFDFVYLLFLPAVFALHHLHRTVNSKLEKWGFRLLVVGLLATFIGVAGDYWADGIGFLLEMLGLLILAISTTMYGIASLRSKVIPSWIAWLLVVSGPGVIVFFPLIGHIPSGPTIPLAIAWLVTGSLLLFKKV